jgi:hypothetical protein
LLWRGRGGRRDVKRYESNYIPVRVKMRNWFILAFYDSLALYWNKDIARAILLEDVLVTWR